MCALRCMLHCRLELLPDAFFRALESDDAGSLTASSTGPLPEEMVGIARHRRQAHRAASTASTATSFLQSFSLSTFITLPSAPTAAASGDWQSAKLNGEGEKRAAAAAAATLAACHFEDAFLDSKFLKSESLKPLAAAIIRAGGPIPRPPGTGKESAEWDVAELALDLLLTVGD